MLAASVVSIIDDETVESTSVEVLIENRLSKVRVSKGVEEISIPCAYPLYFTLLIQTGAAL